MGHFVSRIAELSFRARRIPCQDLVPRLHMSERGFPVDCRQVNELLSPYLDDALDSQSRRAVEEHLAACESCSAERDDLVSYLEAMGSLRRVSAPPDLLESIHDRIDRASPFKKLANLVLFPLQWGRPLRWAGAVAALLVLVITYHGMIMTRDSGYAPPVGQFSRPSQPSQSLRAPVGTPPEAVTGETEPASKTSPSASSTPTSPPDLPSIPGAPVLPGSPAPAVSAALNAPPTPQVSAVPPAPSLSPASPARAVQTVKPIELSLVLTFPQAAGKADNRREEAGLQGSREYPSPMKAGGTAPRSLSSTPHQVAPPAVAPRAQVESPPAATAESPLSEKAGAKGLQFEAEKDRAVKEESAAPVRRARSAKAKPLDGMATEGPGDAVTQVREAIRGAGGTVLSVEYRNSASNPQAITASVPTDNLAGLIDKLRRLGRLSRVPEAPVRTEAQQTVELKIELSFPPP
jgi:hypothetical protein